MRSVNDSASLDRRLSARDGASAAVRTVRDRLAVAISTLDIDIDVDAAWTPAGRPLEG